MSTTLNEIVCEFVEISRRLEYLNEKIGYLITESLKDLIPDLDYTHGEYGTDTIYFYSNKHDVSKIRRKSDIEQFYNFDEIVREVFPQFKWHIECPYGIYLNKELAYKVRNRLMEIKNKDINELEKKFKDE